MPEPPTEDSTSRTPLISFRAPEGLAGENGSPSFLERLQPHYDHWHSQARTYLGTRNHHYAILALVSLDVAAVLAGIFAELVACDRGIKREQWVQDLRAGTEVAGIVFSCVFVAELAVTVWAFGFEYFKSYFHCFDAFVIVLSFLTDVLAKGVLEQIGSLVIVLRLWRMVKIVEEMSAGASEQMDGLEAKIEELELDNGAMRARLGLAARSEE